MTHDSLSPPRVLAVLTAQDSRGTAVHPYMRFFAVALAMSVALGCAGSTSSRDANSPDDENNEEVTDPPNEESGQAEADEDDERKADEESRPAKKRRPAKRRRHVEAAPEPEAPPMYRKPIPPPAAPPPEEIAPAPAPAAYSETVDEGDTTLEAEARKRCHWKNVAPYRPEWANSISPPLAHQRKITSKPICPYGTPPAVVRIARQIAVQQTKLKRR